jgi:hypothetical protein
MNLLHVDFRVRMATGESLESLVLEIEQDIIIESKNKNDLLFDSVVGEIEEILMSNGVSPRR